MCFLLSVLIEDGTTRGGLAAYIVSGGADHCRVGYLPQEYSQFQHMLDGRIMQVTEVYHQSNSQQKQQRAAQYSGLCVGILIDRTPEFELTRVNTRTDGYLTDSTEEGEADRIARAVDRPRRQRLLQRQQMEEELEEFEEGQRELVRIRGPVEETDETDDNHPQQVMRVDWDVDWDAARDAARRQQRRRRTTAAASQNV